MSEGVYGTIVAWVAAAVLLLLGLTRGGHSYLAKNGGRYQYDLVYGKKSKRPSFDRFVSWNQRVVTGFGIVFLAAAVASTVALIRG